MDTNGILELCQRFGYRNIPSSERILLDAEYLEKSTDTSYDNLLELGAVVEFREKNPIMFKDQKDQIELSDRDPMKGVCLTLWSDNIETIRKFRAICRMNLAKDLGWFHQCNATDFQMFEFWKPQSEPMKSLASAIAGDMRLPVLINLSKAYTVGTPVVLGQYKPFSSDWYYEQDNFN